MKAGLIIGLGVIAIAGVGGFLYWQHSKAAANNGGANGGSAANGGGSDAGAAASANAGGNSPAASQAQPDAGSSASPSHNTLFGRSIGAVVGDHKTVAGKALAFANPIAGFKALGGLFHHRRH